MFNGVVKALHRLTVDLVAGLYQVVINYPYQIFACLANTNFFDESSFDDFVDRIYVILGVVVLFLMAYSLLNIIIDPDKNKGGKEVWSFIKKLISSFIIIAVLPFIFQFSVQVQQSIVNNNIIGRFFGDIDADPTSSNDSIRHVGKEMAANTFQAFFTAADGEDESNINSSDKVKYTDENKKVINEKMSLEKANGIARETGKLTIYRAFAGNIMDGEIDFNWFAAIIAGIYLGYCIISFCFDVSLRACKLLFYKIIAPLCIAARIVPKWDDMYKKWLSNIIQTYLSLFQRIIILSFGCYLLNQFFKIDFLTTYCTDCAFGVKLIAKIFVILGICTFIKQAPKLVDELTGIGKGVKFNIGEKFKEGITPPQPILAGASALGAGITSGVQNTAKRRQNINNLKELRKKGLITEEDYKKRARMARLSNSTALGAASGLIRGANQGKNEGELGMLMVGNVVVNRVLANCLTFKNIKSLYDAIYQKNQFVGTSSSLFQARATTLEKRLAQRILQGEYYYPATNALWFYAPTKGSTCKNTWYDQSLAGLYKNHCFYKPNAGVCNELH